MVKKVGKKCLPEGVAKLIKEKAYLVAKLKKLSKRIK